MPSRIAIKTLPFLIVLALSIPFFSPHQFFDITDSMDMLNISVSVYELGDLSSAVKTNLETGETVTVYSKYGLGLPFLMVPFLFLYDLVSAVASIPPDYVLGLLNLLVLALTASALNEVIIELGFSFRRALFLSVASVFGTFAFVYMNNFLSEPLQGLLITLAFLFSLRQGRSGIYPVLSAAALSALILTKAASLILLPFFMVYFTYRSVKERAVIRLVFFILPLAASGAAMMWLNYSRFGSPFDFGYGSEAGMFVNPMLKGIKDLMINPGKGILIYAPLAILFPFGLWRLARTRRIEALLIAALFTSNLLLYSAWWAWEGAGTWGPRFLLPLVPLVVAPIAAILDAVYIKAASAVLSAAGLIVNSMGVIVDPPAYNYMVIESTPPSRFVLESTRPKRDYLKYNGKLQPPPYVITSELSEFNSLSGHYWLLKSRLMGDPLNSPPWLDKYPLLEPPLVQSLPAEIRIRLECPPPLLLSAFACPDKRPSSPYYYNAYTTQATKADANGMTEEAQKLNEKAKRGLEGKTLRVLQFGD